MYPFTDQERKMLEQLTLPLAFFQNEKGQNIPLLVSDGFCQMLGISREWVMKEQKGSKFVRVHPEDVGRVAHAVRSFWKKESDYDVLYRVLRADQTYHYIHSVAFWWPMPDGAEMILVIYLDLEKWSEEMLKNANRYGVFQQDRFYTDPLTALPNLNYLHHFADERANAIRAHGGTPVLIYTDTHSMQFYNNQYGFSHGNDLLCVISEELKNAFPEGLVMRGADDHFVVIDTYTEKADLEKRIRRANHSIRKRAYGNTSGIQAGIAVYEEQMKTAEAMDQAKQAVKLIRDDLNKVVYYYSRGDDEEYWNQRYIVESFDRALAEGWIRVYYQCICRLGSNKGAALEALARWIDPVRGIISPAEFIPVLRRYHLLYKLDLYMMEQVCREIPVRAETGFALIPVSINFAAQDFDYVDIPAELNAIYDRYEISRYVGKDYFLIEITEQDVASATEAFHRQLETLT